MICSHCLSLKVHLSSHGAFLDSTGPLLSVHFYYFLLCLGGGSSFVARCSHLGYSMALTLRTFGTLQRLCVSDCAAEVDCTWEEGSPYLHCDLCSRAACPAFWNYSCLLDLSSSPTNPGNCKPTASNIWARPRPCQYFQRVGEPCWS